MAFLSSVRHRIAGALLVVLAVYIGGCAKESSTPSPAPAPAPTKVTPEAPTKSTPHVGTTTGGGAEVPEPAAKEETPKDETPKEEPKADGEKKE